MGFKKPAGVTLLNFLISAVVFFFSIYTLLYSLLKVDAVMFIVSLIILLVFLNFFMVNSVYLMYGVRIKEENKKVIIELGNVTFVIVPENIIEVRKVKIGKFNFFIISLEDIHFELKRNLAYVFAHLALFPPVFASSFLSFGMMAPFFRDTVDIEAYIDFNRKYRGGEIVLNTSLIGEKEAKILFNLTKYRKN